MTRQIIFAALAVAGLAACNEDRGITGPAALSAEKLAASGVDAAGEPGAVYTLMNQGSGNAVAVLHRAADGTLSAAGSVATGGRGRGPDWGRRAQLR